MSGATDTPVDAGDPQAAVAACRAGGGAERDPVRFHVVEALARRAAAQQGLARQLLVRRVQQLVGELMQAPPVPPVASSPTSSAAQVALRGLVDRLGRPSGGLDATASSGAAAPSSRLREDRPPPLRAVASHTATWSRLRAQQRLRQALAQVPAKAGPLNSSHVVHRALQALHGLSPAYLDAFMAHVDTLLWLEQAAGMADLPLRPNPRPTPRPAVKPAAKSVAKTTRRR